MADAAYQAVSFDGYRAINKPKRFQEGCKGDDYLRHAGMREVDEQDGSDHRSRPRGEI
jgi:hypothetical protein